MQTRFIDPDANSVAIDGYPADNILAVPTSSANQEVPGTAGEAITAGFAVYLSDGSGSKTPGLWYIADAANAYSSALPEIGIAPSSIANGSTGTIRLSGQLTGMTGLTIGTSYYIGTAGALTSTAPANKRFIGVADTVASLIATGNPPDVSVLKLLKSGTGTDTNAAATTVDSVALSGLTALDTLRVMINIETATQNTAQAMLYSVTDAKTIVAVSASPFATASPSVTGEAIIRQRNQLATNYDSLFQGMTSSGARMDFYDIDTFSAWTGAWTLGLRHSGVTAGGTFKWQWAVYRLVGQ